MIISANGIKLNVVQRGAGTPALVFLHYWGGSSRTWQHVVDLLSPDFRTVAIDHRGWGESEAPATGYTLNDLAEDAQGVIAALDLERYILVGHSMGGKVAQLMASRQPPGLIGLALIAPSPPSPLNLPLNIRQGMMRAYDSRDSIAATIEKVLAPGGLTSEDLETVIADSIGGAPAAKAAWPLSASQEDITAAVTNIAIPVIVISGEQDRVDPPEVLRRELLTRIPQAQLHVLPQIGHLSPFQAPSDIADLVKAFALSATDDVNSASRGSGETPQRRCSWCGLTGLVVARKRLGGRKALAPRDGAKPFS